MVFPAIRLGQPASLPLLSSQRQSNYKAILKGKSFFPRLPESPQCTKEKINCSLKFSNMYSCHSVICPIRIKVLHLTKPLSTTSYSVQQTALAMTLDFHFNGREEFSLSNLVLQCLLQNACTQIYTFFWKVLHISLQHWLKCFNSHYYLNTDVQFTYSHYPCQFKF